MLNLVSLLLKLEMYFALLLNLTPGPSPKKERGATGVHLILIKHFILHITFLSHPSPRRKGAGG